MELRVTVTKGEAGYFVAQVPALKGCWSQGRSVDEAVANAKEAAALWLEVEQEKRSRRITRNTDVFAVQI